MPLRDHFRPPVENQASWEGFHALWPGVITMRLNPTLPKGYRAEPRARLGTHFEVDIGGFDRTPQTRPTGGATGGSGAATSLAPEPTYSRVGELTKPYEYEVLLYDEKRGRALVAAIEFVSPGNKDRPESRRAFAAKCATLVMEGVCVLIVDICTDGNWNLYHDTLEQLGCPPDPALGPDPPVIYAATLRSRLDESPSRLDAWTHPLRIGHPLPTLPLWLASDLHVSLDLEPSYEEACQGIGIT